MDGVVAQCTRGDSPLVLGGDGGIGRQFAIPRTFCRLHGINLHLLSRHVIVIEWVIV